MPGGRDGSEPRKALPVAASRASAFAAGIVLGVLEASTATCGFAQLVAPRDAAALAFTITASGFALLIVFVMGVRLRIPSEPDASPIDSITGLSRREWGRWREAVVHMVAWFVAAGSTSVALRAVLDIAPG